MVEISSDSRSGIVGNLNGYNDVQNVKNQNLNGNGNVVEARAEGNATGHNGNQIRCYNCRGQASTSGTQTDIAPVYESDGSTEFLGTIRFGNDHVAVILGFDDL
nr:hypothetical protein [Tanacetum cinerariifolium]